MKIYFAILISLLFVSNAKLAEQKFDYKVLYELKYQLDSLDKSSVKKETLFF